VTYKEIIMRGALAAQGPNESLARLTANAELLFPSVEEELAIAVAMNPVHPWRRNISDVTAAITNGSLIPQTGAAGAQIIGKHGQVTDFADGKVLTESFVLDELRRLVENPGTWRVLPVYAYVIVLPRIFHTRTSVKIDVCVYDVAAQKAAIAADAVTLFPDAEGAYVTALVAKLKDPTAKFGVDLQGQVMLIESKA
jgi:hypothetical protein